jgi:1-acyl-sn-glycerol-3-phosphate acyltransferase
MSRPLPISPLLVRWFTWYSRRFIRHHFHSLRMSFSESWENVDNRAIVIYSNHASWWDPLVGLVVIRSEFSQRTLYAPIDASMLKRYKMFSKMGFFGVEKNSAKGAAAFLAQSTNILNDRNTILAVTAQGRFADVRERPANIKRGLAHLSRKVPDAIFIPACIEYVFWEEKLPEILVRFGRSVSFTGADTDIGERLRVLEHALEQTQDELAEMSQRRASSEFSMLISGRSGIGGVYDRWRKLRGAMRGKPFQAEVGSV